MQNSATRATKLSKFLTPPSLLESPAKSNRPTPASAFHAPPKWGYRKETIEEFKARGGKVQEVDPGPVPKVTESEKVVVEDPRRTARQAGVDLAEDHHIATKFRRENRKILQRSENVRRR